MLLAVFTTVSQQTGDNAVVSRFSMTRGVTRVSTVASLLVLLLVETWVSKLVGC